MKYAGIFLLFLSCVGYGYYCAYQIRMRMKAAEDFSLLIGEIKSEINFTHKTVSEIVAKILATTKSEHISKLLDGSCSPNLNHEKIKANLTSSKNDSVITDTMLYFFDNLGKSDLDGQLSLCELCKSKAEQRLLILREETGKKAKLIESLGVLFGIALAILLF